MERRKQWVEFASTVQTQHFHVTQNHLNCFSWIRVKFICSTINSSILHSILCHLSKLVPQPFTLWKSTSTSPLKCWSWHSGLNLWAGTITAGEVPSNFVEREIICSSILLLKPWSQKVKEFKDSILHIQGHRDDYIHWPNTSRYVSDSYFSHFEWLVFTLLWLVLHC